MKARVKETGEIIDFLGSSIEYGTCTWIDSKGDFNQGPAPGIEILETGKPIDWEQRRYEIAKAAMQGRLSNQYGDVLVGKGYFEGVAVSSVKFADALIAELKKESAGSQNIQKTWEKEVQIGDIIEFGGEKYLCKEARKEQDCNSCDLCRGCGCALSFGHCIAEYRDDGKDLIFQKL